eukprot:scaffold148849_cov49-Attheya_sp.AAC.2
MVHNEKSRSRKTIIQDIPSISPQPYEHFGTQSLTGGSLASLDGQSFNFSTFSGDDVSSINSSALAGAPPESAISIPLGVGGPSKSKTEDKKPNQAVSGATSVSRESGEPPSKKKFLPEWVADSSPWIKKTIIFSTLLLLASIVLVVVALNLDSDDSGGEGGGGGGTRGQSNVADDGFVLASNSPTEVPDLSSPTFSPTTNSQEQVNTDKPESTGDLTPAPNIKTASPTKSPTPRPTGKPTTPNPTTSSNISSKITFYLTSYYDGQNSFQGLLNKIPSGNGNDFMVHLGDWYDQFNSKACNETVYQRFAKSYNDCPVPVFPLIGDSEYNRCDDPSQAMTYWEEYLIGYESRHWTTDFAVTQQENYEYQFAFALHKVLFIGLAVMGGPVEPNEAEWANHHTASVGFVDENVAKYKNDVEVLVVFTNSGPGKTINDDFYVPFAANIPGYEMPVFVMTKSRGDNWNVQESFGGTDFYTVVQVKADKWPPMKVSIDTENNEFNFDQDDWYKNLA